MTALVLMLLACRNANYTLANDESALAGGGDSAIDESDDTGQEQKAAKLWSLAAELELVDGVPTTGTFSVELVGDDTEEPCALPDSLSITTGTSPHPAIFSWFSAPLLPHADSVCDVLPATVWIGLGALDETLEASLPTAGIDTETSGALNGAYLSEDDGETIWVFGVAGPDGAFADGDGNSALDAAEMDGHWSIVPVFDLPLP
jgi:hypothetical protein